MTEASQWFVAPHQPWQSPLRLLSVQPAFFATEVSARLGLVSAALHARNSGRFTLLGCALAAAAAKESLDEKGRVVWPAQGTLMLSPTQSVHRIEVLAFVTYASAVCSEKLGVQGAFARAAMAGMLAHLLKMSYDVNGTRYLYHTWHDDDPEVAQRIFGVPVSSFMKTLAATAATVFGVAWLGEERISVLKIIESQSLLMEEHHRSLLLNIAHLLDRTRDVVGNFGTFSTMSCCAAFSSAITPLLTGFAQIASLDSLGGPTLRSYKVLLYTFAITAFMGMHKSMTRETRLVSIDESLLKTVFCFAVIQSCISVVGNPQRHTSTGTHQPFGKPGVLKPSLGSQLRTEFLSDSSPSGKSREDFQIEGIEIRSLEKKIAASVEELEQLQVFMTRNNEDVEEFSSSYNEATVLRQKALDRLEQSFKNRPSMGSEELFQSLSKCSQQQIDAVAQKLKLKLQEAQNHRSELQMKEVALQNTIRKYKLEFRGHLRDASGQDIIPASEVGQNSLWYTIRGKMSPRMKHEKIATCISALFSVLAFGTALTTFQN